MYNFNFETKQKNNCKRKSRNFKSRKDLKSHIKKNLLLLEAWAANMVTFNSREN